MKRISKQTQAALAGLVTAAVLGIVCSTETVWGLPDASRYTKRIIENANDGDGANDTKTVKDALIEQTWNYYADGALHLINNEAGSTYGMSLNEFHDMTAQYQKLLGNIEYDSTDSLFVKSGSDTIQNLTTIMKVKNKKNSRITNYTDDELKRLTNLIGSDNDTVQSSTIDMDDVTTSELMQAYSHLVKNDYWTTPAEMVFTYAHRSKGGMSPPVFGINQITGKNARRWFYAAEDRENLDTSRTDLRKSDLIMILSKAFCGVQSSKAVVFSDYSVRGGKVWSKQNPANSIMDNGGSYSRNLSNGDPPDASTVYGKTVDDYGYIRYYGAQYVGDYWFYYSPNVYELYLTEALDDGIISVSDLKTGIPFRKEYKNKDSADWNNDGMALDEEIGGKILGQSTQIHRVSKSGKKTIYLTETMPDFFGDKESMTMLEFLKIVESYMRLKDDNMSATEERAVRYKLGLSVLDSLNQHNASTITYLVAKGVLNSSESSLLALLYDNATIARALPIIHRAVNKAARFDFSTISLTDSESVWAAEGFGENSFIVYSDDDLTFHETAREESGKEKEIKDNEKDLDDDAGLHASAGFRVNLKSFLGRVFSLADSLFPISAERVLAASGISEYKVVKYFDTVNVYSYGANGDTIGKIVKDGNLPEGIKSAEKVDYEYNGKKIDAYKVMFFVKAVSLQEAVNVIDNKITFSREIDRDSVTISGVTSYTNYYGKRVSMVSQTALKKGFSGIAVLEDKVLMNTATGATAYFSSENNFALVGNQIVNSQYRVISHASSGEVYYDLDALLPLLSGAFVDVIGTQTNVCLTALYNEQDVKFGNATTDDDDSFLSVQYVRAYCDSLGNDDGKDGFMRIADKEGEAKKSDESVGFLLKLNTMTSGVSLLTKQFVTEYDNMTLTGTVIIDWSYVIPNLENFSRWFEEKIENDVFTYQDAVQVLVTPPDELLSGSGEFSSDTVSALQVWWESNYGMSNALCNYMYGTKGKKYVSSGYMTPSVTILFDSVEGKYTFTKLCSSSYGTEEEERDKILTKLFNGKVLLGDDYIKYNNGTQNCFWSTFFGYGKSANYQYPVLKEYDVSVSELAAATRNFTIEEQQPEKATKKNFTGNLSLDQQIKVYNNDYIVSSCGVVYRNVSSFTGAYSGGQTDAFSITYTIRNGEPEEINTFVFNNRNTKLVHPAELSPVSYWNAGYRYVGIKKYSSTNKSKTFTALTPLTMNDVSGGITPGVISLQLAKSGSKYYMMYKDGQNLYDLYSSGHKDAFKQKMQYFTKMDSSQIMDNVTFDSVMSDRARSFFNPKVSNSVMKEVFANSPPHTYYYVDNKASSLLNYAGAVYEWTGSEAVRVRRKTLEQLCKDKTVIYAMPYYLMPSDKVFFEGTVPSITMHVGTVSKALYYLNMDYSSLNSQLIESYLTDQQGVRTIGSLNSGMQVLVGDSIWTKCGEGDSSEYQSKAIRNSSLVQAALNSQDGSLQQGRYELFGGIYVTANSTPYSLANYVSDMRVGKLVGNKTQRKKGVLYTKTGQENAVLLYKKNSSKAVNTKTTADYLSVSCHFDDRLLVRPLDTDGRYWMLVKQADLGMLSSDDYPFFNEFASWEKQTKRYTDINTAMFSPSAEFLNVKQAFNSRFNEAELHDLRGLFLMVIIALLSYILVMSWVAYGVLTLGLGRSFFDALTLKDINGSRNGVDLIKLFTFKLYDLDMEPTIQRVLFISLGCCAGLLIVLLVI